MTTVAPTTNGPTTTSGTEVDPNVKQSVAPNQDGFDPLNLLPSVLDLGNVGNLLG